MPPSLEVRALIDFVESTGLLYRVTDVDGPGHAAGSLHYAEGTDGHGLAVDFAGVTPGVTFVTRIQMESIYRAFLAYASELAELIYNAPGIAVAVKNGRRVDGPSFYGPAVWADHVDHVHVAVRRGTFLAPLSHPLHTMGGTMPDNDPNLPDITGPVQFTALVNSAGECTGYFIFSEATGELHSFGPGARFYGRSEVTKLVAT